MAATSCLGDIMIECTARAASLPSADQTVILNSVSEGIGGPAFNIFWYLSKFGLNPKLVGAYGSNNKSFFRKEFTENRLNDSGLIRVEGHSDSLFTILIGNHYHSFYLRSSLPPDIERRIRKQCGAPDYLVITGSRHLSIRKAFLSITENLRDTVVVFNPSYAIYEYSNFELIHLLKNSDFVFFNREEATQAIRILKIKTFMELSRFALCPIIVTLGKQGANIYHRNKISHIESVADRAVNPIGAGDAFIAGFLYRIMGRGSVDDSARFGTTLAAYVVESEQTRVFVPKRTIYKRSGNSGAT